MKNLILIALLFVQVIFTQGEALAVTVTATEVIEDIEPLDLFTRNLRRTRSDSNGFLDVQNSDATIVSENNIDSDFGIYNLFDVTYSHVLSWINPLAENFIGLTLEVKAYGIDGGNDVLFADNLNLGALVNDGSLLENTTTTLFTENNLAVLNAILVDNVLNIRINKNSNSSGLALLDSSSVFVSKLTVQYSPVPEPTTVGLLVSSIAGMFLRKRRES